MEELGRDPDSLDVSLFFLNETFPSETEIEIAEETGAERMIFSLPLAQEKDIVKTLDRYVTYLRNDR